MDGGGKTNVRTWGLFYLSSLLHCLQVFMLAQVGEQHKGQTA